MPTVLEVCAVEAPKTINGREVIALDGHSLAGSFRGEQVPDHKTLFFHHAKGRALRHGNWKLVSASKRKWELYDLSRDPLELTDLSKKNPAKLRELEAIWDTESKRHMKQADLK